MLKSLDYGAKGPFFKDNFTLRDTKTFQDALKNNLLQFIDLRFFKNLTCKTWRKILDERKTYLLHIYNRL